MTAGSDVQETLRRLTEPLKVELREVNEQILRLTRELGSLRETQRNIQFVLKRLDPTSSPTRKHRKQGPAPRGDRIDEILAFIESHNGEFADGIIYSNVFKGMKDEGVAIGKETVRAAFGTMHERGIIRLDRTVSGGGKAYMLVGSNGD